MHAAGDKEADARERLGASPSRLKLRRLFRRLFLWRPPSRGDVADWLAEQFETEAKARSVFFLVPIGMMIGIALIDGVGLRMGLGPLLVLTVPMLAWAHHLGGRGLGGAFVLVAAFGLVGMTLAASELRWTGTTIFSGEATVRIEGRVAWRDRDERNRMRYLVRIERTERPVLSRPPEIASILVSSRHEPIPVGGRFEGLVRLRAPSGPAYPGAYDFAFAPFFEGRGANGFALGPPEPPGSQAVSPTLAERLVRLRLAMSDRIRDVIGGGAGAVASALITGERSGIPDDINDWLRATGLSHVLSISGLHMALVAGFAMMLVRGLLAAVPGAALTLPTKKIAAVAALFVATAYLVISGSDVATDRSYVMLSIMLVAILVDRPALTLRNVAIAAIVVMLTTPHAVVTASFQMSFSATAALVGVYGALSRHRARSPNGHKSRPAMGTVLIFLGSLAVSSTIAGAATAPYAAYHFQRIAPYGVIANLIAVPIFSFWIMPLALIAALAMPFGLDAPFLILIGWALDLVFAMAEVLATHLPDAPSGRLTMLGLLVVTAALLFACLSASRLRWTALPVAILGVVLLPDRSAPPELLVYEDGRELATIDAGGRIHALRKKPNDFVFDQWTRAFAAPPDETIPTARSVSRQTRPIAETLSAPNVPSSNTEPTPSAAYDRSPTALSMTMPDRHDGASVAETSSPLSTQFRCEPSPLPDEIRSLRDLPTAPTTTDHPSKGLTHGPENDAKAANARALASIPASETATEDAEPSTGIVQPLIANEQTKTPGTKAIVQNPTTATKPPPPRQICRATTRSGLRIAWTDDYRLVGLVCDTADVAIVARAVALRACRSGARLVTLRTLRESGSLAISRDTKTGRALIDISITNPDEPWNLHRRAAWPEYWRSNGRDADDVKDADGVKAVEANAPVNAR